MIRKRQIPWIHRWSRPMIIGVATIGAIGTAYLTYEKLLGGEVACPTSGCEQVLASPYATVFGLPLTLFGFLGYLSMGLFAAVPLFINPEEKKELRSTLEQWTWLLLFMGGTAMMIFSGYLMYVLVTDIKAVCIYCVGSALLSTSFFVLSLMGREWDDVGQLFFSGIIVSTIVLVGTLGLYAQANPPTVAQNDPRAGIPITTTSGPAEIEFAQYLAQSGVAMYGAYWCPHCHDQKQLFGKEAFKLINYVECDPEGLKSQADLCKSKGIQGYPTWEIKGNLVAGQKTLEELADATGYSGSRNF
jgi:uncharacterized membrane protein/glutaredoxin